MAGYSDTAIDHFEHPRNVGEVPDADGVGLEGVEGQGNFMQITIKVESGRLMDVRFRTYSCPAARASGSAVTVLAKGKAVEDARTICGHDIQAFLGKLPLGKEKAVNMACAALACAIEDCEDRRHKDNGPRGAPRE